MTSKSIFSISFKGFFEECFLKKQKRKQKEIITTNTMLLEFFGN